MFLDFVKEIVQLKIHKEKDVYDLMLNEVLNITGASFCELLVTDQEGSFNAEATLGRKSIELLSPEVLRVDCYGKKKIDLVLFDSESLVNTQKEAIETILLLGFEKLDYLKAQQALRKSQRIFRLTFEQVGSGICQTDLNGVILDANQKFCDIIGYTREEARGLSIEALTHPEDLGLNHVYKKELLERLIPHFSMEKRYIRKDGRWVWVYITVTFMSADAFDDDFLIGIVQDISKQKEAEAVLIEHNEALESLVDKRTKELERLNKVLEAASKKDPLTMLYNRRFLQDRFEEEIDRFLRSDKLFSVVLMDIDSFKRINDQYGHDCGDEMLIKFSELILGEVRSIDVLGRWGGEEFVLLLPETDKQGAALMAERIRARIESYSFIYEGLSFGMTMTFGVCEYSSGLSTKELIKRADAALYEGKAKGRNCVVVWEK